MGINRDINLLYDKYKNECKTATRPPRLELLRNKNGQLKEASKELTCGICRDLFWDPVSLTCGHSFCRKCIIQWREVGQYNFIKCPKCKKRNKTSGRLSSNFSLKNMVSDMVVCCDNMLQRDTWFAVSGEWKVRDLYRCKNVMKLEDRESHYKQCVMTVMQCAKERCKKAMSINQLRYHFMNCSKIRCVHCNTKMLLKNYRLHQCPEKIMKCEHSSRGCIAQVKRREMDAHKESCPFEVLTRVFSKRDEEEKKLKDEIEELKVRIGGHERTKKAAKRKLEETYDIVDKDLEDIFGETDLTIKRGSNVFVSLTVNGNTTLNELKSMIQSKKPRLDLPHDRQELITFPGWNQRSSTEVFGPTRLSEFCRGNIPEELTLKLYNTK